MAISTIGNASFGSDSVINANGIKFPATQVPSADANTLDDYEEGTWTPTITSDSGTITSLTVNSATYTKTGRVVVINLDFTINNNGTGSSRINVTGMPFSATRQFCGVGREYNAVGFILMTITNSTNTLIWKADNTYPGGTNYGLNTTTTYFTST